MSKRASPLVIAIAGGTGSGKTTVANVILGRVGANHIGYLPHDAYYKDLTDLPPAQREHINFDHPNSLDTDMLIRHVQDLKENHPIELPVYDFKTHTDSPIHALSIRRQWTETKQFMILTQNYYLREWKLLAFSILVI